VAWDDGDHDEPQQVDAPAGADRYRCTPVAEVRRPGDFELHVRLTNTFFAAIIKE